MTNVAFERDAYVEADQPLFMAPDTVEPETTIYRVTVGEAPESRPSFNSVQEAGMVTARLAVQASMDLRD